MSQNAARAPRPTPHAISLGDASRALAVDPGAVAHIDVTGVTLDSRDVRPGDLFVALSGERVHGATFAAQAAAAGAVAVATDEAGAELVGHLLPCLVIDGIRARTG